MDISTYRKDLNLSQADLASRLGVTQSTVSRWENGDLKMDTRTLLSLDALKASLSQQAAA